MKKEKIIFWVTTSIIFLTQGLVEFIMFVSGKATDGVVELHYPPYFAFWLILFKVLGSIVLILPYFPKKLKELAYAGFLFDFIFAFISIVSVSGFEAEALAPVVATVILAVSYKYYNKLNS